MPCVCARRGVRKDTLKDARDGAREGALEDAREGDNWKEEGCRCEISVAE